MLVSSQPKTGNISFKRIEAPVYKRENASRTQISATVSSYTKLRDLFEQRYPEFDKMKVLDYGAGKGLGAPIIHADTFEPFARDWEPDYKDPEKINKKYDLITCQYVLNVIPKLKERIGVVKNIAEHLKVGGEAYFVTRGTSAVSRIDNTIPYCDGIVTCKGTFQKGFGQEELESFMEDNLEEGRFLVDKPSLDIQNPKVRIKRLFFTGINKVILPKRDKEFGVGKKIGGKLYVHAQYENIFKNKDIEKFKAQLPEDFKYDIVSYNPKAESFTFTSSPDWDTADEPTVGDQYLVKSDGTIRKMKQGKDPWIYHHKWLFVKDDYKGFDVEQAKDRSFNWMSLGDIDYSRIGKKSFWQENVLSRLEK